MPVLRKRRPAKVDHFDLVHRRLKVVFGSGFDIAPCFLDRLLRPQVEVPEILELMVDEQQVFGLESGISESALPSGRYG